MTLNPFASFERSRMSESSFDASSDPARRPSSPDDGHRQTRPFLGIHFECCRTYARIYRNEQGTAYRGCCPTCRAVINIPIGSGGTSSRFFNAS
jgi:hypothetical protein